MDSSFSNFTRVKVALPCPKSADFSQEGSSLLLAFLFAGYVGRKKLKHDFLLVKKKKQLISRAK